MTSPSIATSAKPPSPDQVASLRATFAAVVSAAMVRYTEIVGTDMAFALHGALNDVAQANRWDIRVTQSGLADTHAFETPEAAARAYRVLTRTINNHMAIVIGARLAMSIMREITQRLEPAQQKLVQDHHLMPDSTFASRGR